jgi:hypothetical protein
MSYDVYETSYVEASLATLATLFQDNELRVMIE